MIIALAGYMGCGKSHVSKILSDKLNFKRIDLDKEISSRNNASISEIFEKKGEIYFRKLENELLKEILATEKNAVLSLGGGTPVYYNNMELINAHTESVFLRASVTTLAQRLSKQKAKRPIISNINQEDFPEFIAKHLFERNAYYSQCKHTVGTDDKTPEKITEEIIQLLGL